MRDKKELNIWDRRDCLTLVIYQLIQSEKEALKET